MTPKRRALNLSVTFVRYFQTHSNETKPKLNERKVYLHEIFFHNVKIIVAR